MSYPLNATNFVNHQIIWPAYSWGNTLNGADVGFTLLDSGPPCGYITNLLKPGRDYFNDTAPKNYTPLVYPHPLQALEVGSGSGSAALPPTLLPPPGDLKVAPGI